MRYTKQPVTIEAVQFTEIKNDQAIFNDDGPDGLVPAPPWLAEAMEKEPQTPGAIWQQGPFRDDPMAECLRIGTLEGVHRCNPGDWIIRGIKGELYPCKPEIFAATYAVAEDSPDAPDEYRKPAGTFRDDLASTINRWSIESESDTPDFMLADFVIDAMQALSNVMDRRERWYGRPPINSLSIEPGRVQAAIAKGETYPPLTETDPSVKPEPVHASETVEDLLYDLAHLLRGYEEHHRAKAENNLHADDRLAKADRNAAYAERIERKLHELISENADLAPLALLADAVKGAVLQQVDNRLYVDFDFPHRSENLFRLLSAAKIAGERA